MHIEAAIQMTFNAKHAFYTVACIFRAFKIQKDNVKYEFCACSVIYFKIFHIFPGSPGKHKLIWSINVC